MSKLYRNSHVYDRPFNVESKDTGRKNLNLVFVVMLSLRRKVVSFYYFLVVRKSRENREKIHKMN